MVKNIWLLGLLLWITTAGIVLADEGFSVKADKKSIALGEPLTLTLTAVDAKQSLSKINLDQLKQNFNLFSISGNVQTQQKKNRSSSTETLTLILYPLRTGKLQLPVLRFSGLGSKPLRVTVLESNKNIQGVIFKTALDIPRPRVRQVATLSLDIYDDGSLQWTAPHELITVGMHQRSLAESQSEEMVAGTRYTVHHYAWALMPLREGNLTVLFPMLDAFKFGSRLRYPLAPLRLNVAAAPAYLPVHVPVGKLEVSAEPLTNEIELQRPVNWILNIEGAGISEEGVKKQFDSISDNESLHFYPAIINNAENERQPSAAQHLRVTLPFVPLRTGALQLPDINIPYFDPVSARIESVYMAGAQVEVFNPLWRSFKKIVLWSLALLFLLALGFGAYRKYSCVLRKKKALLVIKNAASADALHDALLKYEDQHEKNMNCTLQHWLRHMQQFYAFDVQLADLVQRLEVLKYAEDKTGDGILELAHEAAVLLKHYRLCSFGNEMKKLRFKKLSV